MNREMPFCGKLSLSECKDKYLNKTNFSANEMYLSTIRGGAFREYLDGEVSIVGQY